MALRQRRLRFTYEFYTHGTYSYTGMLQSTSYTCTSTTFSSETGTYTVDGALYPPGRGATR